MATSWWLDSGGDTFGAGSVRGDIVGHHKRLSLMNTTTIEERSC